MSIIKRQIMNNKNAKIQATLKALMNDKYKY